MKESKPLYSIDGLCPRGGFGGCGFAIHLAPEFKEAVAVSGITQHHVDKVISLRGLEWLQKCGFSSYFDIENCGYDSDERIIPSDKAKPLYSHREVRVSWGEWGPEHISVPGNACGLDIDKHTLGVVFENGVTLTPHNIDSQNQVMLLLITFTWFAHTLTYGPIYAEYSDE